MELLYLQTSDGMLIDRLSDLERQYFCRERRDKDGSDDDSDEESEEESEEEESEEEEEDGKPELTRAERRELKKKQAPQKPKKKDEEDDQGGEEGSDSDLVNPNHGTAKRLNISDLGSSKPREMSRKERHVYLPDVCWNATYGSYREAKEKKDAQDKYWKVRQPDSLVGNGLLILPSFIFKARLTRPNLISGDWQRSKQSAKPHRRRGRLKLKVIHSYPYLHYMSLISFSHPAKQAEAEAKSKAQKAAQAKKI